MGEQTKRLTLVVTPEVEAQMKDIKREIYYDRTQSEMLRDLMAAGMRACKAEASAAEKRKNA